MRIVAAAVAAGLLAPALHSSRTTPQAPQAGLDSIAVTNVRLVDVETGRIVDDARLIVRDGKITAAGPREATAIPDGLRVVDLRGRYVMPGFIASHVHVSDIDGLRPRAYTDTNTARQLRLYATYGITTIWSLGGEQAAAFRARDARGVAHARLHLAGDVIAARTPDEARQAVASVASLRPDIIKIRVDDNLGTTAKMTPEVSRAVIDEAHRRGLRVAAHIFYLDDAKDLLRAGVDMIAHSVRDKDIDEEFVSLMKARSVPYCPTLTRELAAFVYESTPGFFSDPFFTRSADPALVAQLQEPPRQAAMRASATAQRYKAALEVAKRNLKRAADASLTVVMGTDSGAFPERFQGYFEHLEMEMMAASGMPPVRVLRSATIDAARAMKLDDVGALTPGRWADFVVLERNPLEDITNTRSLVQVWIAGRPILN
jgi:imidazolonepropionase-like amidohydrolase